LHERKRGGTLLRNRKDRLFADKESLYLPDLPGDPHDGAEEYALLYQGFRTGTTEDVTCFTGFIFVSSVDAGEIAYISGNFLTCNGKAKNQYEMRI